MQRGRFRVPQRLWRLCHGGVFGGHLLQIPVSDRGSRDTVVLEGVFMSVVTSESVAPRTSRPNLIDPFRQRVAQTVVGQDQVVERVLIALLTGGHLLLQGMPGLAKTLLVNSVAKAIDLAFARVQFTIDLLPADIIGSEILDQRNSEYRVQK